MISYLYWGLIFGLVVAVVVGIGLKLDSLKTTTLKRTSAFSPNTPRAICCKAA